MKPAPPKSQAQAKRIAIFLPNMGGGGAERVALASARDLVRRGHQVDMILLRAEGELLELLPPEVKVVDLGVSRFRNSIGGIWRYLRSARPDAVHAIMWPITIPVIIAHRLARSRALLMVNDQIAYRPEAENQREQAAVRLTTRLFYDWPDIRIVCSKGAADLLSDISGVARDKFEVIYNPIEPPARLETSPEVTKLWGGADERIIAVGSLKSQKNHALLLRAFAKMHRPSARLMILGEGPLRKELETLCQELGIADRVVMPGFAVDPWPFYASATHFVLSSDYEGFGNVNVEAMYAGLTMVCTDCQSGPREILDDGRYGRLVPIGDVDALATAMSDALDAPADPGRMRKRALEISGPHCIHRYTELLVGDGN